MAHRTCEQSLLLPSLLLFSLQSLLPVPLILAQDAVFLLLSPVTEPLPRGGCWLGVPSQCFLLFASRPLTFSCFPHSCCLWLNLSGPLSQHARQPTLETYPPSLAAHLHTPSPNKNYLGRLTEPLRQLSTVFHDNINLASRLTSQLSHCAPLLCYPSPAFPFSASWFPSFTSATFVYPCLKSNFFWLSSPFQRIPHI